MVTFSIPGDDALGAAVNGTPRSRPPLPFAKRANSAASPFGGSSSAKRFGTPHASSSRKILTTRDDAPSTGLNNGTIAAARNIFRASAITDSPPTSNFSPSIPQNTMKKVFAPGATPEPTRMHRESVAQATPRGMAAKTTNRELFPMRISSPPPELTGEVLTQRVPKDWNSKGSIYADQFLAHLCPPELDEEQRRQFFCILDLRRLKYAANEIFAKKDWKLNVVNFAKEFEKSRSIILLRYGLYEFQNVKPSKEVLRRWRREHGLPEPEDGHDESESTPSKSVAAKKRKADDTELTQGKRRATDRPTEPKHSSVAGDSLLATTLGGPKNKRKAPESDEQPTKIQKATPSSAKSLFEKITNKASAKPAGEESRKPPAGKSSGGSSSLARSVFTNLKANNNPPAPVAAGSSNGSNIFGYLSDASSAKNSGVDADAESETDEESEDQDEEDSPEAGQSDGPSMTASSHAGSSMFTRKPPVAASNLGVSTALSSAPDTRESTPGRSLFDRVTKGSDGQPVRAEEEAIEQQAENEPEPTPAQPKPAVSDQTWNPTTTPIKFAPSSSTAPAGSIFSSQPSSTSASSLFGTKSTTTSTLFGKPPATDASVAEGRQDGGESDKENESQPTKRAMFEAKPSASTLFGSGPGQPKPNSADAPKETEATKSADTLFGGASKPAEAQKPVETRFAGNLFGQTAKAADSAAAPGTPSFGDSSTLFGTKPLVETRETGSGASTGEVSKASPSLFGAPSSSTAIASGPVSLLSAKPTSATSSLFGSGASTPSQQPSMFATPAPSADNTESIATQKPDNPQAPVFNFAGKPGAEASGSSNQAQTMKKHLFDGPKSPPAGTGSNMFGSPMKQDEASPAKKAFGGATTDGNSTPLFAFGGNNPAAAASGGNLFKGTSTHGQNSGLSATPASFGSGAAATATSAPAASGGGSFNFSFGAGGTTGESFSNPFSSGAGGAGPGSTGGMFSFGGGSAAPSGSSTPFQFGAGTGGASTPTGNGMPVFGGNNQGSNNAAPAFPASGAGSAATFSFSAGGATSQGSGPGFGSNQAAPAFNLQPPAGGSTTTGTSKSPFPRRKIAPLKRRV